MFYMIDWNISVFQFCYCSNRDKTYNIFWRIIEWNSTEKWDRDGTGIGERPVLGTPVDYCSYNFAFFIERYTKVLLGLKNISQRICRQLLVQVPYIYYQYLETKAILEQISDRPVSSLKWGAKFSNIDEYEICLLYEYFQLFLF